MSDIATLAAEVVALAERMTPGPWHRPFLMSATPAPHDSDRPIAPADVDGIVGIVNHGPLLAAWALRVIEAAEWVVAASDTLVSERFNDRHHGQTSTGQALRVFKGRRESALSDLLATIGGGE